jgi:1,4-dihydroxy-2-naphthoate octaprenyltransferase
MRRARRECRDAIVHAPRVSAIAAFVRLGRPLFLGGGVLMYALGAAIAMAAGHRVEWARYVLGQSVVTAFQLMTHYANDYFDLEADRANATPTTWSGGSRVLPGGELPAGVALVAAGVLAAIGAVLAVVLALCTHDGAIAATSAAIAVLAWSYSAPPLRLCARGLGELATAVVVTMLVPWLAFAVQAPDHAGGAQLARSIVAPALLQFAMLLAIEFPDAAGDAATGKRTLVVRLGAARAARLYAGCLAAAFAWLPIAYALGWPARVALAAALPAPIAAWRIARLRDHADPAAHERLALFGVGLLVATGAAELAGWLAV